MFVVDTNVLVYAANASCPEHARCRALVEQWRRQKGVWYLTWGVLYGSAISDLHLAALMREHGIKTIYTCDTDFHRFAFLEVRNPMASD